MMPLITHQMTVIKVCRRRRQWGVWCFPPIHPVGIQWQSNPTILVKLFVLYQLTYASWMNHPEWICSAATLPCSQARALTPLVSLYHHRLCIQTTVWPIHLQNWPTVLYGHGCSRGRWPLGNAPPSPYPSSLVLQNCFPRYTERRWAQYTVRTYIRMYVCISLALWQVYLSLFCR